jgi:hypothetical protein
MPHYDEDNIDEWVARVKADAMLQTLIGVTADNIPGASTHRDFIRRLWLESKSNRLKSKSVKPKGKHGKNKLHPNIRVS